MEDCLNDVVVADREAPGAVPGWLGNSPLPPADRVSRQEPPDQGLVSQTSLAETRGARRDRLGHLTQVAAAHVVDEAAHGKVIGEERRGADRRHIVAHTLLQIRERQEVDPGGISSEPRL